jgi:hypothetical protein
MYRNIVCSPITRRAIAECAVTRRVCGATDRSLVPMRNGSIPEECEFIAPTF